MLLVGEVLSAVGGKLVAGVEQTPLSGVAIDSRTIQGGELFVALRGHRFDGHDFAQLALDRGGQGVLIDSPLPHLMRSGDQAVIRVNNTLRALQEIARYHRSRFRLPIIAITGSNGKTTTREMASGILSRRFSTLQSAENLNNHIGLPLTLLRLRTHHRVAVVEMGINRPGELKQLGEIASPQVGLITNVGPTHLEFLDHEEGVAAAKRELLESLGPDGVAILNRDDRHFEFLEAGVRGELLTFGVQNEADVMADQVRPVTDFGSAFRLRIRRDSPEEDAQVSLRVMGRHNVYNALAAAAVARSQGVDIQDIREGLEHFEPVFLRTNLLEIGGIYYLLDAYNANPASVQSALEVLESIPATGKKIAVLGDMLELGKAGPRAHREIGRLLVRTGIYHLIAVGAQSVQMVRGAGLAGMEANRMDHTHRLEDAAQLLRRTAQPGDHVLIKGSRGMAMERILEILRQDMQNETMQHDC